MFGGLVPFNARHSHVVKRSDPWDLRSFFDDFFNDSLFSSFAGMGSMKADVRETDKEYIVEAELPGVDKESIRLDVRDDILNISVERDEQINEERENFIRRERRFGSFGRSFRFENIKEDGITAKYKDGILTVTLPKLEGEKPKSRKIDIQ